MLHIKDIEAFARINEALARTGTHGPHAAFDSGTGPAGERTRHPAVLFARFAAGMMAPRPAAPAAPAPASAPANARSDAARPAATVVTLPPAVSAEDEDVPEDGDTVATVDAIPLACAEVLAFPLRDRDTHDKAADSVGGGGYDFDLMPRRPVTMTGMLTRMFFARR
ncbi:hypothetical protein [Azospirillum halopraeferens]|uniref:hypothetical protein n=1 Tax=Azospirillum halopraeferens TaxID=34010 RepID=UPI00040569C6|nr:hypothetical protein [Azospirillum halopraeferens]